MSVVTLQVQGPAEPRPAASAGIPTPLRGTPAGWLLATGAAALTVLFVLTALNVGGQAVLWENAHWTVAYLLAPVLAFLGYRRSEGEDRSASRWLTVGLTLGAIGMLAWDAQVATSIVTVPAPSDVFFLASAGPIAWGLVRAIVSRLNRAERTVFLLDCLAIIGVVGALVLAAFARRAESLPDPTAGFILLAYPIAFLSAAGMGGLGALMLGVVPRWSGITVLLGGLAITGIAWVLWLQQAVVTLPGAGAPINYVFSVATVLIGIGAYRTRLVPHGVGEDARRATDFVLGLLPMVAVVIALGTIVRLDGEPETGTGPMEKVFALAVVGLAFVRQSLLMADRAASSSLAQEAQRSEQASRVRAEEALSVAAQSQARYSSVVDVFSRLADQMSFGADEADLLRAGSAAFRQLLATTAGDVLLTNPSQDRLIVAMSWGPASIAEGELVADQAPVKCLGIRRGSVYLVADAADELSMACPAHPVARGTLLCVPMLALGQTIGVIHGESDQANAFSADDQRQAARVAGQLALGIANARLVRTMESMALTDPLTRLHNARFFDAFVDHELSVAQREAQSLALVMIDLDRFKEFNDTYGHPAGDEALRAFARAALTVARDSDNVARYGGEEFVVAVRNADAAAAAEVAERIRAAVEHMAIDIGPGRTARITASFGVAATDGHPTDRLTLMRAADRALYLAKKKGRNRVVALETSKPR